MIEAGIEIFGRDGYLAATTKTIAREARVNPALISYYFGGKEGLYRNVVERIVDEIGARVGPVAESVEAKRREIESAAGRGAGRAMYLELTTTLLERLVDVLTADESAAWAKIIMREQQEPSAAFEILYARLQGRFLGQLAGLIARASGRAAPTAADRLTALTLIGQILVFRVARATALRFTGWDALRPRETARIKRIVRRNVAAILESEASDA